MEVETHFVSFFMGELGCYSKSFKVQQGVCIGELKLTVGVVKNVNVVK